MKNKYFPKCKKTKSVSEFCKNVARKDGLQSACRECHKDYKKHWQQSNRGKMSQRNRDKRHSQTEKGKKVHIRSQMKYSYDLTDKEVDLILKNRKIVPCEICNNLPDKHLLQIDHDHITGEARGLLCRSCNVRLAGIDNQEFLKKALKYLKKYD